MPKKRNEYTRLIYTNIKSALFKTFKRQQFT